MNAAVTADAWAYLEADDLDTAIEQASTLSAREFETGDPLDVQIESVVLDD